MVYGDQRGLLESGLTVQRLFHISWNKQNIDYVWSVWEWALEHWLLKGILVHWQETKPKILQKGASYIDNTFNLHKMSYWLKKTKLRLVLAVHQETLLSMENDAGYGVSVELCNRICLFQLITNIICHPSSYMEKIMRNCQQQRTITDTSLNFCTCKTLIVIWNSNMVQLNHFNFIHLSVSHSIIK